MKARAPKSGHGSGYPYAATDTFADVVRNWVTADGKNAADDIVHYFGEWTNETIAGSIVNGWRLPRPCYPRVLEAVAEYRARHIIKGLL